MNTSRPRVRRRFVVEALEGRVALSHMGAVVEDGPHHNRGGHVAEVHTLRHGADDAVNHDANDDNGAAAGSTGTVEPVHNGGVPEAVHRHRGGVKAAAHAHRGGAEHPAVHK